MWLLLFVVSSYAITLNRSITLDPNNWEYFGSLCLAEICPDQFNWFVPHTLVLANSINLPKSGTIYRNINLSEGIFNLTGYLTIRGTQGYFRIQVLMNNINVGNINLNNLSQDNQTISFPLHVSNISNEVNLSLIISTPQSLGNQSYLDILELQIFYQVNDELTLRKFIGYFLGGLLITAGIFIAIYGSIKKFCCQVEPRFVQV